MHLKGEVCSAGVNNSYAVIIFTVLPRSVKPPASTIHTVLFGQLCVCTSVQNLFTLVEGESFPTFGLLLASKTNQHSYTHTHTHTEQDTSTYTHTERHGVYRCLYMVPTTLSCIYM